jgi:hypothetical protein
MSVVIVGADHLGSIEKNLYALGVKELIHITGRKRLTQNSVTIPEDTAFVLVMTDYVNHNTALSVKELAKMKEIPLIHAKRSWSAVQEKLVAQGLICCN